MNSEVYRAVLSAQIESNAAELLRRCFTVQMDNDPKHTVKATQELPKAKKWNILQWPNQLPDLNPAEHAYHLLKTKLRAERPTCHWQWKAAAVKTWKSISWEESQHLLMFMGFRFQAVSECKQFSSKT